MGKNIVELVRVRIVNGKCKFEDIIAAAKNFYYNSATTRDDIMYLVSSATRAYHLREPKFEDFIAVNSDAVLPATAVT
ncbi:hypothetical protein ACP70R_005519 [Stipagrostis hirtigluma subsp. patula]